MIAFKASHKPQGGVVLLVQGHAPLENLNYTPPPQSHSLMTRLVFKQWGGGDVQHWDVIVICEI